MCWETRQPVVGKSKRWWGERWFQLHFSLLCFRGNKHDGIIRASGLTALTRLGKCPRVCRHERFTSSSLNAKHFLITPALLSSASHIDLWVFVRLGIWGLVSAVIFNLLHLWRIKSTICCCRKWLWKEFPVEVSLCFPQERIWTEPAWPTSPGRGVEQRPAAHT